MVDLARAARSGSKSGSLSDRGFGLECGGFGDTRGDVRTRWRYWGVPAKTVGNARGEQRCLPEWNSRRSVNCRLPSHTLSRFSIIASSARYADSLNHDSRRYVVRRCEGA